LRKGLLNNVAEMTSFARIDHHFMHLAIVNADYLPRHKYSAYVIRLAADGFKRLEDERQLLSASARVTTQIARTSQRRSPSPPVCPSFLAKKASSSVRLRHTVGTLALSILPS
jgi:hypothetical protein